MQREKINIFITSCETTKGAWRCEEQKLKAIYELSNKKYSLTSDPESADIILVGNVREENWSTKVMNHDLINKYPNKCFLLSDRDIPLILNHGIYACGSKKSILSFGRVRTGSYTISFGDRFRNPFIENHVFSDQDYLEKEYLLSFIGRNSSKIRNSIFNLKFERPDIYIEDSSKTFDLWGKQEYREKVERRKYYNMFLRSKFSLCPRGYGTSSMRTFESMKLGIAPIIVSDDWRLPKGPMWNEFSIFIKEKNIRDLEKIVESHSDSYKEMGQKARKAFEEFFADDVYFNYVIDNCLDIMNKQLIPEVIYWKLNTPYILLRKLKQLLRQKLGQNLGQQKFKKI
ncbi:hypothetical protein C6A36_00305 [Desulfobacteraceae bacterium SEEP-SAG10]|nr:hypothetical protein C6A36_00305 [Desulfobacteraceae bacterium SEEP-SAG10]